MSKKTTKIAEEQKPMFQVWVNGEAKFESSNPSAITEIIQVLKEENVSPIYEVNHRIEIVYVHTKDRYEQNYRVTGGEYSEFKPKEVVGVPAETMEEGETPKKITDGDI